MYTATKHRGFVMISYYDIRHARNAKTALQSKPLRRRKLDIHYSIPKENPSDKDMNQGTLVIFNLEPAVSNEELLQIFGAFGEVREVKSVTLYLLTDPIIVHRILRNPYILLESFVKINFNSMFYIILCFTPGADKRDTT
jgi:RNA recognition motif-containing protein